MTVTYGFYDSLSGDRKYNARQMSQLFKGMITDGIFQSIGGGFVVTPNAGMVLNVASGRAWFNYTWTDNDATITVTVLASEAVLNRIDTVVIEVNTDVGTRANTIKVIKGTPASSPVAPTMANTATLHQYPLADIAVGAGVTSINVGNITNRIGTAATPFITGMLQSFDVATLMGRYDSLFNAWFTNLVNQLSGSQVTNLQAQIDALVLQNKGWQLVTDAWTYNSATVVNVPSDATLKYTKGWGVRFKQGGAFKYFIMRSISATALTLYAGTDYSVANAAITEISVAPLPSMAVGFPSYFNYSPTWTSDGTQPSLGNGSLTGTVVFVGNTYKAFGHLLLGTTSTIGTSTYRLGLPFPSIINGLGTSLLLDISAVLYTEGVSQFNASDTSVIVIVGNTIVQHSSPMTFASGDHIWFGAEATF